MTIKVKYIVLYTLILQKNHFKDIPGDIRDVECIHKVIILILLHSYLLSNGQLLYLPARPVLPNARRRRRVYNTGRMGHRVCIH